MSAYVRVASLQELRPGRSKTVHVMGHAIALYHAEDHAEGRIYATSDICPHEGVSLGTGGSLAGCVITCGYHFWSFDIRTGASDDGMDECLETYPVKIVGSDILVLLPVQGTVVPGMDV